MKITGINIPPNFMDKGLDKIDIDRLGDTVIIAGKNGAGKTRLLDIIVSTKDNTSLLTSGEYESIHNQIKNCELLIKKSPDKNKKSEKMKTKLEQRLVNDSYFKIDVRQEKYNVVKFVPNKLTFKTPNNITPQQQEDYHSAAKNLSNIENINDYVLSYIHQESEKNFFATHQDYHENPESTSFRNSFNSLKELINTFLGTQIAMREKRCTLFNRFLENANLSDGQKVLLQLCVLIHAQGAALDNMILILDEPENHLHPAAQIEFIKKMGHD